MREPFYLGRFLYPVSIATVLWIAFILVMFYLPGLLSSGPQMAQTWWAMGWSAVGLDWGELLESLDKTYKHILKEFKKPNRVDFDDADGILRLNSDQQWEDQEQALLIACLSLITVIEAGDGNLEAEMDDGDFCIEASDLQIIQFSHFSVCW